MERISISRLWYSQNEYEWTSELDAYWKRIKPEHRIIEIELNKINIQNIKEMSKEEWYVFLINKYFKWKYSAANRYATTTRYLRKYEEENKLKELNLIKEKLLKIDKTDIKNLIKTLKKIKGLGTAGASGLLALLYPKSFGTVDQFVVKALMEIKDLPELERIKKINPENISISNGVFLIGIMKKKAKSLNLLFNCNFWTPRKIDMILWTYGR